MEDEEAKKRRRREALLAAIAQPEEEHPPPAAAATAASDDDKDEDGDGGTGLASAEEEGKGARREFVQINANEEEIELFNLRIFNLNELELEKLTNCTSLGIRKNLIHVLDPKLPAFLERQLVALDLFDNKIKKIPLDFFGDPVDESVTPPVPPCARYMCLRKLDLSYNQIKEIRGLDFLSATLEELYLVENKIKTIQGLESLTKLKLLELGGNRLREVGDGLKTLVNLEQLWIGKNKIDRIGGTGFTTLAKLERLSMQANRMTVLSSDVFPPGANPKLKELYLSENGLTQIENVENLHTLTLLDYSFNPIKSLLIPGAETPTTCLTVTNFPNLEEFWMTDAQIEDWKELDVLQPFSATLRTVYLERNPIEKDKRYRNKVHLALPFITQIDSWPVIDRDNPEADRALRRE